MQTGIDIEKIQRFDLFLNNKEKLIKIFTKNEIGYAMKFKSPVEHLAGIFCAKEAVSKALKTGLYTGFSPIEIEILHRDNGVPYVNITDKILELLGSNEIDISISHSGDYAIAICVIG